MQQEKFKACLDQLTSLEMKTLKFYLKHKQMNVNMLENVNASFELADQLVQHFTSNAQDVLVEIFRKLPRNDLANKLQKEDSMNTELPEGKKNKRKAENRTDLDRYDMSNKRIAFMMCVTEDRLGAGNDIMVVREMAAKFGFTLEECINPTGDKITESVIEFRDSINKFAEDVSCCLVVLMSHGNGSGQILGRDMKPVSVEKIFEYFNNIECPKLQKKPKIFIIQACRGKERDFGVKADSEPMDDSNDDDFASSRKLPTASDYYIIYSSQKGYISLRCQDTGSPMITTMKKVISEHGLEWHIGDIFTKVNSKLVERDFKMKHEENAVKVTMVMESTLTKAVYLASPDQ
ncbi:caspase-14-like [Eublepharis macularius]|uniref:Caspase-14-like n=1 Tax=Eublepharis macularius TaxID=481883 RepID=A0AA97K270_EUBMA|nr:caspase-14-like [Eublepharis macularius]